MGIYSESIKDRVSGIRKDYAISADGGNSWTQQFYSIADIKQILQCAKQYGWHLIIIPCSKEIYVKLDGTLSV